MIRELYQKGWSLTAIAQETGFDRKTIRKYINAEQLPRSSKRTKRASKLDAYKPYLLQRIQEGTTNCVVLLEEIRAQGFDGKSTILKDFVQPYRERPKKQATRRFETPPGQQAQMDWAEVGLYEVDGRLQKIYAFYPTCKLAQVGNFIPAIMGKIKPALTVLKLFGRTSNKKTTPVISRVVFLLLAYRLF